ncbi:hypothetical protein AB0C90_35500 [Streptomyces sp. NPDC048550]|uniref:hypothetical protein n=1 Tax=unclassified Streptomyces TaxID=2593676 RepID=UPI003420BE66
MAALFVLVGAFMLVLGSEATAQSDPPDVVYVVLADSCFALAAVAVVDLYVCGRRTREQRRWNRPV